MDEITKLLRATTEWLEVTKTLSETGQKRAYATMAMICLTELTKVEDPDERRTLIVNVMANSGMHDLMERELNSWAQAN